MSTIVVSIFDYCYYLLVPNGPFPLSDELAGNHGSCVNQNTRPVPDDEKNYHDSYRHVSRGNWSLPENVKSFSRFLRQNETGGTYFWRSDFMETSLKRDDFIPLFVAT